MKYPCCCLLFLGLCLVVIVNGDGVSPVKSETQSVRKIGEISGDEGRGSLGKNTNKKCKYRRGNWSTCDPQTKTKSRVFTLKLKKGKAGGGEDESKCEKTKIIKKNCKIKEKKIKGPKGPEGGGGGEGGGGKKGPKDRENRRNMNNKNARGGGGGGGGGKKDKERVKGQGRKGNKTEGREKNNKPKN